VPPSIAKKYDFDIPEYHGLDQVVELSSGGERI
jgi:NAD(P)H-hydrate epimerase